MVHDFFEHAHEALISDLTKRLKPFSDVTGKKFAIGIMNTGDERYLVNMYKDDIKQFYQTVPRMAIQTGGMSILPDQLTSQRIYGYLTDDVDGIKKEMVTYVRRIPVLSTMTAQVYFENILQYYSFVEIVLMTSFRLNTYSFFHAGKIHGGRYSFTTEYDKEANLALENNHESRNIVMRMVFELTLQMPAYDYYNGKYLMDATNTISQIIDNISGNDFLKETTTLPHDCGCD